MWRALPKGLGAKGRATFLPVDRADFGAAPGHPEQARFDDARQASLVSRLSPTPFQVEDRNRQTNSEQRREIHRRTRSAHSCPACKKTSQKQAPQNSNVPRPSAAATD